MRALLDTALRARVLYMCANPWPFGFVMTMMLLDLPILHHSLIPILPAS